MSGLSPQLQGNPFDVGAGIEDVSQQGPNIQALLAQLGLDDQMDPRSQNRGVL